MPYRYSVVSGIPRGVAIRKPTADITKGSYYHWKLKTWVPFKAVDNVQGCMSDADNIKLQLLEIPDGVLENGYIIMEYDTYAAANVPVLVGSWDWWVPATPEPAAVTIHVRGQITPVG